VVDKAEAPAEWMAAWVANITDPGEQGKVVLFGDYTSRFPAMRMHTAVIGRSNFEADHLRVLS